MGKVKISILSSVIFFIVTMLVTTNAHSRPDNYYKELSVLVERAKVDLNNHQLTLRKESNILASEYRKSEQLKKRSARYLRLFNKARQRAEESRRLKRKEIDRSPVYKGEYEYYNSLYKLSQQDIALQRKRVSNARQAVNISKGRLTKLTQRQGRKNLYCATGICCPDYPNWVCIEASKEESLIGRPALIR